MKRRGGSVCFCWTSTFSTGRLCPWASPAGRARSRSCAGPFLARPEEGASISSAFQPSWVITVPVERKRSVASAERTSVTACVTRVR